MHHANGNSLRLSFRRRLAIIVDARGERAALATLGISRHLLYRALAGLALRKGSAFFVEQAVARAELSASDGRPRGES